MSTTIKYSGKNLYQRPFMPNVHGTDYFNSESLNSQKKRSEDCSFVVDWQLSDNRKDPLQMSLNFPEK